MNKVAFDDFRCSFVCIGSVVSRDILFIVSTTVCPENTRLEFEKISSVRSPDPSSADLIPASGTQTTFELTPVQLRILTSARLPVCTRSELCIIKLACIRAGLFWAADFLS
ncbi:hypothetical protein F511_43768 [Dorcoceras hygrometricum]|uniref:Uncharacterized protein n=1 Tax=Dorcoceras hygrometricum TaxID=472368 RepID=A0A2Z7C7T8_9LAMI|nr:hypothetical protein F511_43768 [Dorcoceras hygrometricum]